MHDDYTDFQDPQNTALRVSLSSEGYFGFREVQGKLCGNHQYYTSCAIVVGLDYMSYERRYCYQDRKEAETALASWDSKEPHPPGNWIKLKGTFEGRSVDYLNPLWVSLGEQS